MSIRSSGGVLPALNAPRAVCITHVEEAGCGARAPNCPICGLESADIRLTASSSDRGEINRAHRSPLHARDICTAGQVLLMTLKARTSCWQGTRDQGFFLPLSSNKHTVLSLCRGCLRQPCCFHPNPGHEGACSEEVFALLREGVMKREEGAALPDGPHSAPAARARL